MPYSVVLLDLDHTLFDFDASERAAFLAMVGDVDGDFGAAEFATYKVLNAALWKQVERGEILAGDVRDRRTADFCAELGLNVDQQRMTQAFIDGLGTFGDLYPGATSLLDKLHGSVMMGLATNGISIVQRNKMTRLGLDRYFDAVVISDEVGVAKPDPEFFDLLLGELGEPERDSVLMVGDGLGSDIQGGINAGIATCWYNPHSQPRTLDIEPTHEVANLADVAAFVVG